MRVVLQRVNYCKLTSGDYYSEIGFGLLATVGISRDDTIKDIEYLVKKIVNLRIFKDSEDKSNLSLIDVSGDIMIVSNFTLQARIGSGTRPDYSKSGDSEHALQLFNLFVEEFKKNFEGKVSIGNFKHHMHLDCELDGPFNLILESEGRK